MLLTERAGVEGGVESGDVPTTVRSSYGPWGTGGMSQRIASSSKVNSCQIMLSKSSLDSEVLTCGSSTSDMSIKTNAQWLNGIN